MNPSPSPGVHEGDHATFARWEGAIALRLFGDAPDPTLTVPEQIAAKVGDRILDGRLAPGARIAEQELSDEFKVSRGPVREAIRLLEREGLATVLPRRGAVVTEMSARDLRELFEIRASLFELVARRVMAERPPELIAVLRAGVAKLEQLAQVPEGSDAYVETGYRLMMITTRFCGNERLQRMMSSLALQTLRYSKLGLASVERRAQSAQAWRAAQQALESGDLEALTQLTRLRIQASGDEAARQLDDSYSLV